MGFRAGGLYQISNLSTHTQRGQARVPRESLLVHSKHHTANMATLHRTMFMMLVLVVLPLVPALPAKAKSRTIQSFFSTAQQSVASASGISGRPPAPAPPPPAPPPPKPKTPQEVFEKTGQNTLGYVLVMKMSRSCIARSVSIPNSTPFPTTNPTPSFTGLLTLSAFRGNSPHTNSCTKL